MVRKSERNKVGAEKPATSKKPTRSSRRRKKSTSESEPEPDVPAEETAEQIPLPPQEVEVVEKTEPPKTPGRRGRPRRQPPADEAAPTVEPPATNQEWNEDEGFWGESSKAAEAEAPKMDNENSTWKIQSSNGSGGEIQKLKICRQRLTDSAESSSSPAKEIASPRRKRKGKDQHLDLDGTESTGSHTDTDTPTSTVAPALPNDETPVDQNDIVETTSQQENSEEIPLPQEEPVTVEADSATAEEVDDSAAHKEEIQETEATKENEDEEIKEKDIEAEEQEQEQEEPVNPDETVTESGETLIIEPEADIDLADATVEEVTIVEVSTREDSPDKVAEYEEEETPPCEPDHAVEAVEEPSAEPEPTPAPKTPSQTAEGEDEEEGELKPAKKSSRNLNLSVSAEDAMQQIAKKLNERAARFSKEATEEAARRTAPQKVKSAAIEEDEEEGEISRDPGSTKTLELKRLSDDDIEPCNKRQERKRRPVSDSSASSDAQKDNSLEATKKYDVSTELLPPSLLDGLEPIPEEEALQILAPKDDEPEARDALSDDVDSAGETGEIAEEEGELLEDEKDGRKSLDGKRSSSRDEPKRIERRVTKESKDVRKSSRKDGRSSEDEPRSKKKYEKENKEKRSPSKNKTAERMEKPEVPKSEENHKTVRKVALVSDDTKPIRRSISPPAKKPSCILFITNLVRPFTIGQLKELLNRTGTISPNGFYIDKIKSKCFVKYNDVEMAIETRHALHGVRWPVTNPRTLRVEFSTDDAMEAVKKQAEEEDNAAKKQDLVAQNIDKGWLSEKDIVKPPKKPKNLVREWDMGKDVNEVAAKNDVKNGKEAEWGVKAKDKNKEDGRRRPLSPSQDKGEPTAKKIKRRDTDAPAKLLDDLFRKTNATPCIYWLPLTAAQIAVKEEMRRQHMAEHQKRLAELRKSETSRRDNDKSRDRDRERERGRDRRRK